MSCISCQDSCVESTQECECQIKDFSTDCILYSGPDLTCSGITSGKSLTSLLGELDEFICTKFTEVSNYLTLTNVGTGVELYKGISFIGNKEIKTVLNGNYITITDSGEELIIGGYKSSETQIGNIQIATQVDTDAGVDDEKSITPLKLHQYLQSTLPFTRIKNIGKIFSVEVGDQQVGNSYTVSGDITSCVKTSNVGSLDTFRFVLNNPMDNTDYYVKVFYETISDPDTDNNKKTPVFQTVSTTEFDLFIESDVSSTLDLVNIYVEVVQI